MPEDYQAHVDRIVDTFPPLSDEQRSQLRVLLAHTPRPDCSSCDDSRRRVDDAGAGSDLAC